MKEIKTAIEIKDQIIAGNRIHLHRCRQFN